MANHGRRWRAGDHVVLRETWKGRIWTARPAIVVADAADLVALYVPPGVRWKRPVGPDGRPLRLPDRWTLADRTWRNRALFLVQPGSAHAVVLSWSEEGDGRFLGWYVNLQEPLRRIPAGFEYMDQALDIVISPDRSNWRWKDEDELQEAVARGIFSADTANSVRAEGRRVVRRMRKGLPPFCQGWEKWKPDPLWAKPHLPERWAALG